MPHSTPLVAPVCAGLDVSLQTVDFFVLKGKQSFSGCTPRRAPALSRLALQLLDAGVELVVLEATGGLETLVWSVLEQAGLKVAVVSPRRVRHFARSLGQEAKTDRLDAALLAELPELGRMSGSQAASLAGLAPRARDSGARHAPRSIAGGRPRARRALFVAAWNARRSDSAMAAFYDRLLAAGKPKKVIHIAIARKLLVALNSMLAHHSDWRPSPLLPSP